MGEPIDHLAHGSEALGLHELLLKLTAERYIANRCHHANDFAAAANQRARGSTQRTPIAVTMLRGELDVANLLHPGEDVAVKTCGFGKVRTRSNNLADDFVRVPPQHIMHARAHERVAQILIDDEDRIRETLNETTIELLLLRELGFHVATGRDIDERALVSHHASFVVVD